MYYAANSLPFGPSPRIDFEDRLAVISKFLILEWLIDFESRLLDDGQKGNTA
jgi:hypothetical protein